MEDGKSLRKRQLPLDMNDSRDDLDSPQLLIVDAQEPPSNNMDHHANGDVASMPDAKLEQLIERLRKNIDAGFFAKLPDRGQKFIASLKIHEEEYEQRKVRRSNPTASERHVMPRKSTDSCINGMSESITHNASFHSPAKSLFAAHFSRTIEENKDCRVVNASDQDFALLRGCGHGNMKPKPQRERQKDQSSSNYSPTQTTSNFSRMCINCGHKSLHHHGKDGDAEELVNHCECVQHIHHHYHHKDMQNASLDLMKYTAVEKTYVRVHSKADANYFLSVRDGNLILSPFHQHDDSQHWYKDERHSTMKDEEGRPSFALVNKATGQAIKSLLDFNSPVVMAKYNAEVTDPSLLWTIGPELGGKEGYKSLRPVGNFKLNMEAVHADLGAYDGTPINIVANWTGKTNQIWKITHF